MLRIRNLRNKYQKRLIRPLYGQTQATPYAAVLDPAFRDTTGSFVAPTTANDDSLFGLTRSANAYLLQNGLVPGTVMVKSDAEAVIVAAGADSASSPFGLLANFVGGDLDELGDEDFVGVWRGPDSVYELLAPAFDDTGLSAAYVAATPGVPVGLYATADGRLGCAAALVGGTAGSKTLVAQLIERVSASRIIIDLKV